MLEAVKGLNLLVMFALELAVYASVIAWGLTIRAKAPAAVGAGGSTAVRSRPSSKALGLVVGIGAAIALAVVWSIFGSPRASVPVHGAGRVVLEVLWFGSGAAALFAAGRRNLALGFTAVFAVCALLRILWNQ